MTESPLSFGAAQAEVGAAELVVLDLHARALSGDPTATGAALAAAEAEVRLCTARLAAAQNAEIDAQRQRHALAAQATKAAVLESYQSSRSALAQLLGDADSALRDLLAACDAHQQLLTEGIQDLRQAGGQVDVTIIGNPAEHEFAAVIGGKRLWSAQAEAVAAGLVLAALRRPGRLTTAPALVAALEVAGGTGTALSKLRGDGVAADAPTGHTRS